MRPAKQKNQTATELWGQVFDRLAKQENASIVDPEYDATEGERRFRRGMKEAGWSDDHIATYLDVSNERIASAPVTSPGVNPDVEALFQRLSTDVESAMDRLGLHSHAQVARGIEPRLGPHAAKIGVIMTDESIVTVGSHLFRFCGLVARAVTRTINLNPYLWDAEDWDERGAAKILYSSPELLTYWMSIYLSYATTGTNYLVPFRPATSNELFLFEQIARAMELFAIAHEYGHHHHAHGKSIEAQPHTEEFQADQFALKICYEAERSPHILNSPYLSSGAGGAVLLLALEQLRVFEAHIGRKVVSADSHPAALSRIQRMDSVAVMRPVEFKGLKNFRAGMVRLMLLVNRTLSEALPKMPLREFADIRRNIAPDM